MKRTNELRLIKVDDQYPEWLSHETRTKLIDGKLLQQKWIDEADGRKFEWRDIELVPDVSEENKA